MGTVTAVQWPALGVKLDQGWWVPIDCGSAGVHPVLSQLPELKQIDEAMEHVAHWRVVVQGGARAGLWPHRLSSLFERVIAFEPDPTNFMCCQLNLARFTNVRLLPFALGQHTTPARFNRSRHSDGMHYISPNGNHDDLVGMFAIDDLQLPACDAIFLDCEGYDLEALKGAKKTLERFGPTLIVEENVLIERYGRARGDVERYLRDFGYILVHEHHMFTAEQQAARVFPGSDLIFICAR